MSICKPEALLFDIGGVLIDIDCSLAVQAWSRFSVLGPEDLQQFFRFDLAFEQHERGEIPSRAYFDHIRTTLQLSASNEEIEAGWNAIFIEELSETRMLVERARQTIPCYAFTNTNSSDLKRFKTLFPEVASAFDKIFASHHIGFRKPERAAFSYICQTLAVEPSSILFFDDLPENVEGAQDAGLQAVLVRSPRDVADALVGFA